MMTKIREGYKETEIGVIPEGWEVTRICDVSSFISNGFVGTASPYYSSDENATLYLMGNNVRENYIDKRTLVRINDEFTEKYTKSKIFKDDMLTVQSGHIGTSCIVTEEFDNAHCHAVIITRFDKTKVNPDYQAYYINSSVGKSRLKSLFVGTTIKHINTKDLKVFQIPLPPLPEQQRIAEILSTTDSHIEKLDKTIEDYQLLKKGMMKKLLTEGIGHTEFKETEIGRIPKEWEVKTLGVICTIIAGQSPSSETYNESGIGLPFYQGRTEFGSINPITKKWCSEPIKIAEALDILISVRAPVGDVNICETKSCIGRGLALIRETKSSKHKFIYYLMQLSIDRLNKVGQGSTFTAINTSDLNNFSIQVPSIEEQELIADNLFEIDKLIELLKEDRNDLILLKKSLMEKLLTGKVRVL